jgi:hydrogenase maturation protein HypF
MPFSAGSQRIKAVYDIKGVVQGVGFRPALFRLAEEASLSGYVQNRSGTVRLALEGEWSQIEEFLRTLPERLPAVARIDSVSMVEKQALAAGEQSDTFSILESEGGESITPLIPADLSMCPDCLAEIEDRSGRRYGYAFTTCTNCGPRYTVVDGMPYDRERTSMAGFPLCPDCLREYRDPRDRRFHAETIACPVCGPTLALTDIRGRSVAGDPLRAARRELARGAIVAVRGVGGFLLAVNAFDRAALSRLRERKTRPHKPFAVMAADLETLRRCCELPPAAVELLTSVRSPIVILDVLEKPDLPQVLPLDLISPDTRTLGVMLPTSPLHHLLFAPLKGDPVPLFRLLIMTSGNRGGEPICLNDEEARERLAGIADFLLTHDRDINLRNDDSLATVQGGHAQVWRRARGYAPEAVSLSRSLKRCVLAMGAEMKNAVALGFDERVVLSPHVGDLETPEALDSLEMVARRLPEFLKQRPEQIAVDLHPDMQSTRLGERLAAAGGLPLARIQHHRAHAAACLAENGCEEGLALVFDGTGLGPDGSIWGAELLEVRPDGFRRLASFAPAVLPGGDAAVRRPARQLIARFRQAGLPVSEAWREALSVAPEEAAVWERQSARGLNAPASHAAGRLFDAVAVLLGITPAETTYDGQPPIRLEAAARRAETPGNGARPEPLPFSLREEGGLLLVDWQPTFRLLYDFKASRGRQEEAALALHLGVAKAAVKMVEYGLSRSPLRRVGLSGGVFMNKILHRLLSADLSALHLDVLVHSQTPPNDGCIAFGQAVAAGWI